MTHYHSFALALSVLAGAALSAAWFRWRSRRRSHVLVRPEAVHGDPYPSDTGEVTIVRRAPVEVPRVELDVLEFDPRKLLDGIGSQLASAADAKALELVCSVDPDVPGRLRGDPTRLHQVLLALAGNAIESTARGEVAVRADVAAESATEVLLRFTVRDTRSGIPDDRLSPLANSRQLVELMGGRIELSSTPGRGSEFTLAIPFERKPGAACAGPELAGSKLLLVLDNETARDALARQLSAWGATVTCASDAVDAVRALDADRLRAVFVDLAADAPEAISALLRAARADSRPIVLHSPRVHSGDEAAFALLPKPVLHRDLVQVAGRLKREGASEAPESTPQAPADVCTTRAARILVAEDDATNQVVALGLLQLLGHPFVTIVSNGREAVQALTLADYDVVLMDIQMPELNGVEATAIIRDPASTVRNHAVPIVAMTAHALKGDREHYLASGMDDYVPKPVTVRSLGDALARWLGTPPVEAAASVPAVDASAVFDRDGVLARLGGNHELLERGLAIFVEHACEHVARLADAVAADALDEAHRVAHALKGSAASVGAERVRALALQLEIAAKTGDTPTLVPALERLRSELAAFEAEAHAAAGSPGPH